MEQGVVRLTCIFVYLLLVCPPLAWGQDIAEVLDTGGHTGIIWDMDVSADGRYLVSGSGDRSVRIWDLVQGRCERVIPMADVSGHQGKVFAVALSPDGKTLAVGGWMGKTADDAAMGRILLLDFPEGVFAGSVQGASGPTYALAFSPDGRFLAAGSGDGSVRIWDVRRRSLVNTLHGHALPVRCLAFLGMEKLVSGSDDGTLIVWATDTGTPLGVLSGHVGAVRCVAVSPDEKLIVSGGYDRTVRLWDAVAMGPLRELTTQQRPVFSVSFSADGRKVLTSIGDKGLGDNACRIFYTSSGREKIAYNGHTNTVLNSLFIPGTHLAASAGGEHLEICVWDTRTVKTVHRFVGSGRKISTVGWNSDGTTVFWSFVGEDVQEKDGKTIFDDGEDFSMHMGDDGLVSLGPSVQPVNAHYAVDQAGVYRLQRMVGPSGGCEVLTITRRGNPQAAIRRTAKDGVEHLTASLTPDGKYVLSGGAFGALSMYRSRDGVKIRDFVGHKGSVTSLAVSPDGTRLVSGAVDETVRLWNLKTGELLLTVFSAADGEWIGWTPEGYYICSPSGEKYLRLQVAGMENGVPQRYYAQDYGTYLYRPDVVAATLKLGASALILKSGRASRITPSFLTEAAPPDVNIIRPLSGARVSSDTLPLIFILDGQNMSNCTVRVNGHPVAPPLGGAALRPGRNRLSVTLEPGINTVGITTLSDRGTRSRAETRVQRVYASWERPASASPGDLYVLGIGVKVLKTFGRMNLPGAAKDARVVTRTFEALKGNGYNKVHSRLLSDDYGEQPVTGNISKGISWLAKARKQDTVVLFLQGQAVSTAQNRSLFLPGDAQSDGQGGFAHETVFDLDALFRTLGQLPSRCLVFLDVAHAGPLDMTSVLRQGRNRGVAVLGVTRSGQEHVRTRRKLPFGPFAYALAKGLGPGFFADSSKDGVVRIKELASYVQNLVHEVDPALTPALVLPVGFGDIAVAGPPNKEAIYADATQSSDP